MKPVLYLDFGYNVRLESSLNVNVQSNASSDSDSSQESHFSLTKVSHKQIDKAISDTRIVETLDKLIFTDPLQIFNWLKGKLASTPKYQTMLGELEPQLGMQEQT